MAAKISRSWPPRISCIRLQEKKNVVMEESTATCSTMGVSMVDRLTVSCPPETFLEEDEDALEDVEDDVVQVVIPPTLTENMNSSNHVEIVLDGEVEPFVIQKPEKPGETESAGRSYSNSRQCSSIDENEKAEDLPNDEDEIPQADAFGFFVDGNESANSAFRSSIDLKTLRKREQKWLQMIGNWRFFMDHKFEKVRDRSRKGIPPSVRGEAWKYLCGAQFHMSIGSNKDVFERCLAGEVDEKYADEIEKDLNRQFPNHEMFARSGKFGENGREDLATLLRCWTVLFPNEGYCQGQAPIAAVLLMHMPLKDAFYCFVQVCLRYLPNYYSAGLEAVQIDGEVLNLLLKDKLSVTYRHFKKHGVMPVLYMIEWFMCLFCRTLPWPTVLRVWDMFFCEGVKVLFKVALVLLKNGIGTKEQCKEYPDLHAIVTRLKHLPPHVMAEDCMVQKVIEMKLDDNEMEKLHTRVVKLRRLKERQDLRLD